MAPMSQSLSNLLPLSQGAGWKDDLSQLIKALVIPLFSVQRLMHSYHPEKDSGKQNGQLVELSISE